MKEKFKYNINYKKYIKNGGKKMKKFIFLAIILMFASSCGVIQRANMRKAVRSRGGSCEYVQGVGELCSFPVKD